MIICKRIISYHLIFLAALCSGCSNKSDPTDPIVLNIVQVKGDASFFLKDAGNADTPYRLNYVQLGGGTLIQEALNSGKLDLSATSEVPAIFSSSQDTTRIIASTENDTNFTGILVGAKSGIKRLSDLRGKRIGYLPASNKQLFLLSILQEAGLTWNDVVPVPMPHQDAAAAFIGGHIDAWVMEGIQTVIAEKKYGARMLAGVPSEHAGFYTISSNKQTLSDPKKVTAIRDYLGRIIKTYRWMAQHPDQVNRKAAQLFDVDLKLYEEYRSHRNAEAKILPVSAKAIAHQQGVADFFLKVGVLQKPVDVSLFWDDRFNDVLQAQFQTSTKQGVHP